MAFNPTTHELWLEVKAAIEETRQHVEPAADIIRRMTGRFYRRDNQGMDPDPENFGYAFVSNILPALGIRNPRVKIKASRVIGHQIVAQAMTDGMESWIDDVDLAGITNPVHVDFLWSRGVVLHYLEEDTRFSRGAVTPAVKRIDPRRFFQDALADDANTDAFRGHWYWADVDDLLLDPDLLSEAKDKISPGGDDGQTTDTGKTTFSKKSGSQLGRKRVKCYSVWIRERNTIRVLCEATQTVELYPERPYYGPPTGPYQLYDAYPIPGQPWPLPPIVAVEDQVRDLNVHALAMGRAAARRKSIGLVEANNPDLGDKLADAEDGEIVPVRGITGNHVIIELGGATREQYTYTEYLRNRLDRISGLTATVQGNVGQADTATEAKIADDALSNRVRYLKHRIIRATESSLQKIGWYMFHTEGIVIPVNRRDPYSGEMVEGLFFGGPSPTDGGATWDDFSLRITIQDENRLAQQTQMMGFYQVFFQIAQAAPMMPWVRWMNVLRDLSQAWGMEDKGDEWMIPEYFGAFSQPQQFPPSAVLGTMPMPPQRGMEFRPRLGWAAPTGFNQQGQAIGPRPVPPSVQENGGTSMMNGMATSTAGPGV